RLSLRSRTLSTPSATPTPARLSTRSSPRWPTLPSAPTLTRGKASRATIAAYAAAAGWRDFLSFCERRGAEPLPASDATVAGYLAELAAAGLTLRTCRHHRPPPGGHLPGAQGRRSALANELVARAPYPRRHPPLDRHRPDRQGAGAGTRPEA